MLGKLFGRKDASKPRKDVAIIHQSVPDEVLNIQPANPETLDTSWMDETKVVDKPKPAKTPTPPPAKAATAAPAPAPPTAAPAAPAPISAAANPKAATGTRYPHGWLVVVEGPGVGEWFVLENGVSQIGQNADQTIPLTFGDTSIAPQGHAQLSYDDARHSFVLDNAGESGARVNGVVAARPAVLRDGDVITVGGTSLRLVALCSQNFNWSEVTRATDG